jgi:hypothetical protein
MKFSEAANILSDLTIEFSSSGDKFQAIKLPLNSQDWLSLCMREYTPKDYDFPSQYIGGCCGNMSAVQDTLNSWLRDGEWVRASELVDVGEAMRDHDDENEMFSDAMSLDNIKEAAQFFVSEPVSPWWIIAFCYQLVKDNYDGTIGRPFAVANHLSKEEEALSVISNISHSLSWRRALGEDTTFHSSSEAVKIKAMIQFGPAIKLLNEEFDNLVPDPIEAWALVDLSKGERRVASWSGVRSLRGGFAIFNKKEDAQKVLDMLKNDEPLAIRPVRVSYEEGLVFTDDDSKQEWATGENKK